MKWLLKSLVVVMILCCGFITIGNAAENPAYNKMYELLSEKLGQRSAELMIGQMPQFRAYDQKNNSPELTRQLAKTVNANAYEIIEQEWVENAWVNTERTVSTYAGDLVVEAVGYEVENCPDESGFCQEYA